MNNSISFLSMKEINKLTPSDIRSLVDQYKYQFSQWEEDTRKLLSLYAYEHLDAGDKIFLALYLEYGSSRVLGKYFKVSHSTVCKAIHRIRKQMLSIIDGVKDRI